MKDMYMLSVLAALAGGIMFFMWTIGTGDINVIMGIR